MAEKSEIFFYLNDQNKKKQTPTRFQPRFQVWPAPNEDWKFNGNSIKAKTAPLDLDRIDFQCSNNDDRQWNALPDSHWNSSSTKKLISLIQRSKRHIWCETKKNKKKTKEKQRQLENGIQLAQLVSRGKSDPRWIETETIGSKCERFRSEFLPSFSIKTFFFKKVLPHSILVFTGYGYEKKKRRENGRTLRPSIDDITSRKPMNEWGMANKMKKKKRPSQK